MNKTEIFEALRPFLVTYLAGGVTDVVLAQQNAPRPARPYMTVLVNVNAEMENPNVAAPGADGNCSIENEQSVSVSLQVYGDKNNDAMDILHGMRQVFNRPTALAALRGAGIPFVRALNNVTDTSEVVGTQYENRANLDIELRAVSVVTDAVGVIESVELTATHDSGTGNNYETTTQIGA